MNAAAGVVEVRVPDMGNFKDVAVIDVLVKPGDSIAIDTPLVTLESDKATMDVPSTAVGVIEKLHTSKGGTVNTGDLIATVRADGAQRPASAAAAAGPTAAPAAPAAAPAGRPAEAVAAAAAPPAAPAPAAAARAPAAQAASAPAAAPQDPTTQARGTSAAGKSSSARGAVLTPRSLLGVPTSYRSDLAPIDEPGFTRAHASPSVRRFARELGVNLAQVTGHGFKERITQDDVKAFVKGTLATAPAPAAAGGAPQTGAPGAGARAPASAPGPAPLSAPAPAPSPAPPTVDYTQFGPTALEPLSRIQRISGPRLQASWTTIPHVTQFDEADITELEQLRASLKDRAQAAGVKLTPLAFIMRACVKALQEFPRFNSALAADGANLIVRKYVHMGFAADTPNGLVVPVVRDADRKDIYELARHLGQLSEKARAGKLPPTDMQGGCFTISSLGGIGGTAFTPIINAPEVAILGVSRSVMRPVYRDLTFVPRLMLPLSLSYDHRVIDGAMAARFTTWLAHALAEPRGLLEAVP
ncbi:MAG TPA: 2-oxo acid dehydrogenase subunit E2 [Steroidobacteraceae bacterium]|nr:2-oxo acid dehydrogenase subunit E2 [Steroidobacteraceae bacterium]